MENSTIREGLTTALMLSKVASTPHEVEINGIGTVRLSKNSAAVHLPQKGWRKLSKKNMEQYLEELLKEPVQRRSKRKTAPLVFSAA